jgi:malate dehydrogenase
MSFLTNDKLTIVGAAGMIGSNMAQTAAMMRLTPNICLYDPFEKGLEGVVEEMRHCGFDDINFTYSSDVKEAFTGSKYMISSGGAPRKDGMTREDLLKGNAEIAAQLGKDIKSYCPELQHLTVIFNPADITGLVALIYSGLKPSQVTTLAALDSTRLQSELAKHFGVAQNKVTNARTYGGHGEQMAVFASTAKVDGKPLTDLIGTDALTNEEWAELKTRVTKGGANIIKLRGRSSFQSPAYTSVEMIRATMGGEAFRWPAGCYVNEQGFEHIMMAMETTLDKNGVSFGKVNGTEAELAELKQSYSHLVKLRDEVISMGIIPTTDQWNSVNPNGVVSALGEPAYALSECDSASSNISRYQCSCPFLNRLVSVCLCDNTAALSLNTTCTLSSLIPSVRSEYVSSGS